MKIKDLQARKILSSVSQYAIEITLETDKGKFVGSAPKGTSKGKHEVKEYIGGFNKIIKSVNNNIKRTLKRTKITNIKDVLNFEEKTKKLGGNVVLSISYALLKALAADKKVPVWKLFTKKKKLPMVLNKIIGGGKHAGKYAPTFQEFLVLHKLKDIQKSLILHEKVGESWGDWGKDLEGGWIFYAADDKAFEILRRFDKTSKLGTDVAASSFYKEGKYIYKGSSPIKKDGILMLPKVVKTDIEQKKYIKDIQQRYNLYYIEDPLDEEDFRGFAELTKILGKKTLIVGDDLFVTDPERLKKGINLGACNACIVKPNQIGSLKKTIEFVELAKKNNYTTIISHRSGETNDDILADLAVGLQIPIMKIGIAGGERVSKINRLFGIMGE